MIIAVVVAAVIVFYYRYLSGDRWLIQASLGLQLGGALGNLLDRVCYGHVIDFVDFKVWPVFNLADTAIVVAVTILAWHLWRYERLSAEGSEVPSRFNRS
jgi:signal peptidase II